MKYILMMNTMKAGNPGFPGWSKDDIQNHIAFMMRADKELRKSGELVSAEGLSFPDEARLVRAGEKPLKMPIEVRPIMGGPPPEFL